MPFLLTIFGWSYLATKVPFFKDWVPSVNGFSPFSVLTFLGVYVVSRILSRVEVEKWKIWWIILAALVSGTACWVGLCHYNSPFALIFAGSIFLLVRKLEVRARSVERLVGWLGPSMFSVYLLHTNSAGLGLLRQVESRLMEQGWNYYAMAFVVAGAIFVGGILLDLPRRVIGTWLKR